MKISDILRPNDVLLIDNVDTKRQLLEKMSAAIAQGTKIDAMTMFDIVWERENLGTTAFGGGTALPHGRIPGLDNVKGMFAKLGKGLDFEAKDGKEVDLVFMLISPENSGADHLSALAQISKIVKDEKNCEKIRQAQTVAEIYQILIQD